MKIRTLITIIFILLNYFSSAQYSSTISGRIDGLGSGKKVILGNKPNGINPSFNFIKYDSTISFNDSFRFKKIVFQNPVYYSLEFEGSKGWQNERENRSFCQ